MVEKVMAGGQSLDCSEAEILLHRTTSGPLFLARLEVTRLFSQPVEASDVCKPAGPAFHRSEIHMLVIHGLDQVC